MRRWMTVAVAAVVALAVGVGVGAVIWMDGHGGDGPDDHAGMGHAAALGEQDFLRMMVPHHDSALAMARLAVERSGRPEVREFAQDVLDGQRAEVTMMERFHREFFGGELEPDTSGPHGMVDLSGLENAEGEAFDRMFLELMIPHHASALTMVDAMRAGGPRPELDMLGDGIVASQAREIGEMQAWLDEWSAAG